MELFVVTGGTSGIGQAIAEAAARSLANIEVVVVSRAKKSSVGFRHIAADLSTEAGIERTIAELHSSGQPIRTLVNCAGAILDTEPVASTTFSVLSASFALHSIAPLLLACGLRERLVASSASIINVGSIYGGIADVDVPGYVLAKAPVPILTEMLAKAMAPTVRVNCILPGHVDTPMTSTAPLDYVEAVKSRTPAARLATPAEVANLVMFLQSESAAFINGATIRIDGGYWCSRI